MSFSNITKKHNHRYLFSIFLFTNTPIIVKIYVLNILKEDINMPRFILDTCIACGTCKENCPVDCIEEGDIYVIDEDACIDCGVCDANCPVDCIITK